MLPMDAEDAGDLSWRHGDPFDRLLPAQAIRQGLILVTADKTMRAFDDVAQLWAG
jgi:PIN domain nuclease of toxin-antitoxin system